MLGLWNVGGWVQRFMAMTGLEGKLLGIWERTRTGPERQMLWWTTNGLMKRTVPSRSIVDTSFVEEAAQAVPER